MIRVITPYLAFKTTIWSTFSCPLLPNIRQNTALEVPRIYLFVLLIRILLSETWVTTHRDMTRLEAAETRFLRSVPGYTRPDKIRSEDIRQELGISGIQDVRLKYKQNWINHLERTDNTRLPKYALTYKPRGRRDRGRPRKHGNASMPEQVKRPNLWRKMMMTGKYRSNRRRPCANTTLLQIAYGLSWIEPGTPLW